MYDTLFLGILAFVLAIVATPLATTLATRLNLLDQPDDYRKIHKIPVPRVGGAAVVVACLCAFWALVIAGNLNLGVGSSLGPLFSLAAPLSPAATIIILLGLVDDIIELPARTKLIGQIMAALAAYACGIRLDYFTDPMIGGALNLVITVGWLVACCNAMNFIDGIDGAAAGIGAIASLTVTAFALIHGDSALASLSVLFAAGLLGFLCFNFHPASVFLGDCGSLSIGFLLGCFGLLWTHKATTPMGFIAPVFVLLVPLADVTLAIVRRSMAGKSVFAADANHVHHRLLAKGFPVRNAVTTLYAACIAASSVAILQSTAGLPTAVAATAMFTFAMFRAISYLGFQEVAPARHVIELTATPRKAPTSQTAKMPVAVNE